MGVVAFENSNVRMLTSATRTAKTKMILCSATTEKVAERSKKSATQPAKPLSAKHSKAASKKPKMASELANKTRRAGLLLANQAVRLATKTAFF